MISKRYIYEHHNNSKLGATKPHNFKHQGILPPTENIGIKPPLVSVQGILENKNKGCKQKIEGFMFFSGVF